LSRVLSTHSTTPRREETFLQIELTAPSAWKATKDMTKRARKAKATNTEKKLKKANRATTMKMENALRDKAKKNNTTEMKAKNKKSSEKELCFNCLNNFKNFYYFKTLLRTNGHC
jgi:iron uptake system EfeUOB component EfeO/EfeM